MMLCLWCCPTVRTLTWDSVKDLAVQMAKIVKMDAMPLDAGKVTQDFLLAEDNESTITVNAVRTVFLAMLLPWMRRSSARRWDTYERMHRIDSGRYVMANLVER